MSHQHVPSSSFHQVNKAHSTGRHDTKGTLKKKQKGKVEARVSVKNASKIMSKQDKRKQQQELAKSKKNAILERKRFGTIEGAPKIVAMIALGPVEDSEKMQNLLLAHCGKPGASTFGEEGPCTVSLTSKQRMTLFNAPRDIMSVLDISKVADILLLIIPAAEGVDKTGEKLISVIKAQGVPNVIGILEGADKIPAKKQHEVKKDRQKTLHQYFPDEPRLLPLDTAEDAAQVVRFVENCTVRAVHWREKRPYLFVDKLSADEASGDVATVRVSGYLRGGNMSANQLVHLPGIGDFQLRKIEMISDPFPVGRVRSHDAETMAGDNSAQALATDEPDNSQETLETENTPDLLLNEQTWPTPEELASAKKKKVPKGTSDYQATWLDAEGEGEEGAEAGEGEGRQNEEEGQDMEDEGEHGGDHEANGERDEEEEGDEEGEGEDEEEGDGLSDAESIAESKAGSEASRLSKSERADDELNFPDEVETPLDKPARVRFQKYRGLKSFRQTEWDPKENLPLDYGRIFQFSNFNRSMKKATDTTDNKIPAGCYVTLHIDRVPVSYAKNYDPKKPYVVGGLFKYENKMSVLQFNIQKHHTYEPPVQSKDSLVFHVGIRRYTCEPIYSVMSPGCSKQKFERFLQPSRPSCATIYGPVTFPPNPLLVFSQEGDLVATGSLHSVDPDRIIVKKIILTGKPYKVHRRGAVIRDMFHFAEDAAWFRPVELWTKNGKVGHIKESVGTHGDIKCLFDDPIQQHDTVCLSLYKRVFPKWPKVSPSRQFQIGASDEAQKSDKADDEDMDE